ncbi:MFS transporter [Microlunatus soli]|uniref:Major Facilitator Superfamily protein n=1 Tax=Microlunatus soli TaxID=630515 RepID=A0A1H1V971_9ACTN|nr:MFS transporter [Microlunatus soli]SDS81298.1 Major Facilitator Superfamily protein [Microlunatus soli]
MADLAEAVPLSGQRSRRALLAVASVGTFLALMTYTLPLSDVGTISRVFAAGPVALTWILGSMSLGLTVSMLIAGTLADRYGRRRIFQLGLAVLILGTVICLLAGAAPAGLRSALFVVGRIVQGAGAAGTIAAALALIGVGFRQPAERATASGIWGAALGAGIAAGPFAAAAADRLGHWWLAYALIAIAAVALAAFCAAAVTESTGERRRSDALGVLIFLAAAMLIMVGLIELRSTAPRWVAGIMIIAAAGLFAGFVRLELRRAEPMLDPRFFAEPRFAAVHLAAFITGVGSVGLLSLSGTFMITVLDSSVLLSAIMIGIWAITSVLVSLASRWLPAWIAGGRQLVAGLVLSGLGQLLMTAPQSVTGLWPGMLIAGIGVGVVNAGLGRETVASAPAGRGGLGSGVNNSARYLGSAIGIALSALLLTTLGWPVAVLVASMILIAGAVAVLALTVRAELLRPRLPAAR